MNTTYKSDYAASLNGDLGQLIQSARERADANGAPHRTLTLDELIEAITPALDFRIAAAYADGRSDSLREAAAAIYNGAGDPEQEFYDVGVSPWLTARADAERAPWARADQ